MPTPASLAGAEDGLSPRERYRRKRALIGAWCSAWVRFQAEELAAEAGLTLSAWASQALEDAVRRQRQAADAEVAADPPSEAAEAGS